MIQVKRGTYSAIQNLTPADGQIVAEKASDGKYDGIRIGNGKDKVSSLPKLGAGLQHKEQMIYDPDYAVQPGIYNCEITQTSSWILPDYTSPSQTTGVLIVSSGGESQFTFQILQIFDVQYDCSRLFHRLYDAVHGYWRPWETDIPANRIKTIHVNSLSDMDVTRSGIYNVWFDSQISISGGSDITHLDDEGILVVHARNESSAFQLFLRLDQYNRNSECFAYWRFVNNGDDNYPYPTTNFKRI